jgi:hypothetical protein
MEFAGIYGTRQSMQVPIEIGIVICPPNAEVPSFFGKAFNWPIDVELWKNRTDDLGKRIDGKRRVFNLASPGRSRQFDHNYSLDAAGWQAAQRAVARLNRDLKDFMQVLSREDIATLVFFSGRLEIEALRNSRVRTSRFAIRDLQDEIRSRFHLREDISLDRAALVAGLVIGETEIRSLHFSYPVPERYRYLMKPHKAIGDAARMFLVDLEGSRFPDQFGSRLTGHIEEYDQRRIAGKSLQQGENGQFRPQTM